MSQTALELLERLNEYSQQDAKRRTRLKECLMDPDSEYAEGWFMCVPNCFLDELDIRQTERVEDGRKEWIWTQGTAFSFGEGDILYDTPGAYQSWAEALKSIKLCVQVISGTAAGTVSEGSLRSPGSVTIDILRPDKERTKLVSCGQLNLTQDEFVHFLVSGQGWTGTGIQENPIVPSPI